MGLDEDIIQRVLRMGFDKSQLLESLQNRTQNDATVAYYLLYDNRSLVSSGYLGAEFQESMEPCSPGFYSEGDLHLSTHGFPQDLGPHMARERNWLVGLQTSAQPRILMNQVLSTLQELNVRWKKIGHYNMKCIWLHNFPERESLATNHVDDHIYLANETVVPQTVLKFELQLYKVRDERYVLDLQRVTGPQFLFLEFCALLVVMLEAS